MSVIEFNNDEYPISQWQIDESRKRTISYLRNPKNCSSIDDFLNEIENELPQPN
jgi:archaellum component FlaC